MSRSEDSLMEALKELDKSHGQKHDFILADFSKPDEALTSYDLAHHAGLSLEEEYEFLGLLDEKQRLEYLKRHLAKVLPVVSGMENLKEKIQLNGHFTKLKGFTFDL